MIGMAIVIATVVASFMLALVMWAFRRHALSVEDSALTDLVAGIFWLATALMLRGIWWDGVQYMIGNAAFRKLYRSDLGPWPNIIFHLLVIAATWRLLRGFWLMIPEQERSHYNFLTAAFYPRRIRLYLIRKGEDNG